jgi:hypothetical protein
VIRDGVLDDSYASGAPTALIAFTPPSGEPRRKAGSAQLVPDSETLLGRCRAWLLAEISDAAAENGKSRGLGWTCWGHFVALVSDRSDCGDGGTRPMSDKPGIDSVFCSAIEIESPEERRAYVEQVCGEDVDLKQQVERLLHAHFHGRSILVAPAANLTASPPLGGGAG